MPEYWEDVFIWIPRGQTTNYTIKLDNVVTTTDCLSSSFTKVLCPEIGSFHIELNNNDESYTEKYKNEEQVELLLDFSNGTTRRFLGIIEKRMKEFKDRGNILILDGSHVSSELLDITVTEEYNETITCDQILIQLVSSYLSGKGYTTTNVTASSVRPKLKWQNIPFYEAVYDLCKSAGFDAYVDDNKDFHFFLKGSINNEDEAIVWNDTLIEVEGIGEDSIEIRNKITVYGEDNEGLPIIATSSSNSSKLKEKIIKDTNIKTESQASDIALLSRIDTAPTKGRALSWILHSLNPGEKIWIDNPPQKIHQRTRIFKLTHKFPEEQTEVEIEQLTEIPEILKNRISSETALENIPNPYKMIGSYNFTFDDSNNISLLDNLVISDGALKMTSGTKGIMVSAIKTLDSNISSVHLKTIGEGITGTEFWISVDGVNYELISIETLYNLTLTPGKKLRLKIIFNSTSTVLNSVALLYK